MVLASLPRDCLTVQDIQERFGRPSGNCAGTLDEHGQLRVSEGWAKDFISRPHCLKGEAHRAVNLQRCPQKRPVSLRLFRVCGKTCACCGASKQRKRRDRPSFALCLFLVQGPVDARTIHSGPLFLSWSSYVHRRKYSRMQMAKGPEGVQTLGALAAPRAVVSKTTA